MSIHKLLLLTLVAIGFTACSQQTNKKDSTNSLKAYELLDPTNFQKRISSEPGVIIDVRTPSEQAKGIIKDAVKLDIFSDFFNAEIDKLDKSKTYYVYCAAGGRSLEACELMQKKGFAHVVDLDGGFKRWKNEGLPVEIGK